MTYRKPEVVRASTAINAIQYQLSKIDGSVMDSPSTQPRLTATAYEADE